MRLRQWKKYLLLAVRATVVRAEIALYCRISAIKVSVSRLPKRFQGTREHGHKFFQRKPAREQKENKAGKTETKAVL